VTDGVAREADPLAGGSVSRSPQAGSSAYGRQQTPRGQASNSLRQRALPGGCEVAIWGSAVRRRAGERPNRLAGHRQSVRLLLFRARSQERAAPSSPAANCPGRRGPEPTPRFALKPQATPHVPLHTHLGLGKVVSTLEHGSGVRRLKNRVA